MFPRRIGSRSSQAGLEPIRAGRFYVRTPATRRAAAERCDRLRDRGGARIRHRASRDDDRLPDDARPAARARAAASTISSMSAPAPACSPSPRCALWPRARVAASDIDPVAIAVTDENAAVNGVAVGRGRAAGSSWSSRAGLDHPRLRARAPYDLIIANILAGPLIELAPVLRAARCCRAASLILAGLLDTQATRSPPPIGARACGWRTASRWRLADAEDGEAAALLATTTPVGPSRETTAPACRGRLEADSAS